MIGKALGHYEILEPLGKGGMGEVYLAEDRRLGRRVAIKVLPEEFAGDPERLARFEQEARAAAALNHPHIAAVFDVGAKTMEGSEVPSHFMVQEYLEGNTLREPLKKGALPLEKALDLATEVGEALIAAHKAGIIHRDLKPDNIFVTEEGHAKVLDFGLAKLTEARAPAGSQASMSPTMLGTVAGQVMGTAGYMAPEQIQGEGAIDHRADLFAFGCVLYEMVSGRQPFAGKSAHDTLHRIGHEEPSSLADIDPSLPLELARVTKKCLEKKAERRYQDADDLVVDLAALAREVGSGAAVPIAGAHAAASPRPGAIPWTVAVPATAALVAIAAWATWVLTGADSPKPTNPARFEIGLPEGTRFPSGVGTNLTVSSRGDVVFVAETASGNQLYLKRLDDSAAEPIRGTENAVRPFFSPDGLWIGFTRGEDIHRVSLSGDELYSVCESCDWGSWGDDGNIYFEWQGTLGRIPATGGDKELMAEPRPDEGLPYLSRPVLLPGGTSLLFEIGDAEMGGVGVLSLVTNELEVVSTNGADPFYSHTGHIIFAQEDTLLAVPFDAEAFELTGQPVPVLPGVRVENGGALQAALSSDGLLVYQPSRRDIGTQLVFVDANGENVQLVSPEWNRYRGPRLSPEGEQIAVGIMEGGNSDIWTVNVETGTMFALTTSGDAADPVWTPTGDRVAYASGSLGSYAIKSRPVDGSGTEDTLHTSEFQIWPEAWHPDGFRLVFRENAGNNDLFFLDVRDGTVTALVDTELSDHSAAVSHDGELLAYVSNFSGTNEVYIKRLTEPGVGTPVSRGGGYSPVWSHDDRVLYYRNDALDYRVATIRREPDLRAVATRLAWPGTSFWPATDRAHWEAHPDGRRFLFLNQRSAEDTGQDKMYVVLNWFEELKQRVPIE